MQFYVLFAVCVSLASALSPAKLHALDANVAILRQDQVINPDGSYHYSYESENGIAAQETGEQKGGDTLEAQGSYQYVSPDGTPIAVQYISNENGFQPQGAHIPQVPEYILRALEWNAAHPEEESGEVVIKQNPFRG